MDYIKQIRLFITKDILKKCLIYNNYVNLYNKGKEENVKQNYV